MSKNLGVLLFLTIMLFDSVGIIFLSSSSSHIGSNFSGVSIDQLGETENHPYDQVSEEKKGSRGQSEINRGKSFQPMANLSQLITLQSSESCSRIYPWSSLTSGNLIFSTPSAYNSTVSTILFNVMENPTVMEVEGSESGDKSRVEQAQAFILANDGLVSSISIYAEGNKAVTKTVQIRNETYYGVPLYSQSITLENGWNSIQISPNLALAAGKYFVWMEVGGNPAERAWFRSPIGNNDTETWIFNSGSWEVANFDLTLKVTVSNVIDPESVDMMVESVPVITTGIGMGEVMITSPITSSLLELEVTYTGSISYSYTATSIFSRTKSHPTTALYNSDEIKYTANLDLNFDSMSYQNYAANVSDFLPTFSEIVFTKNEMTIGHLIENNMAMLSSLADKVSFKSLNYIVGANISEPACSGMPFFIEIAVLSEGIVNVSIADKFGVVNYFTSEYMSDQYLFRWDIPPITSSERYNLEIIFVNSTKLGYFKEEFMVFKKSRIEIANITTRALEMVDVSCVLVDEYSEAPLEDAIVTYEIAQLSGGFEHSPLYEGTYFEALDLDTFALKPGTYVLTVSAVKEGYQPISTSVNFIIQPRNLEITLITESSQVTAGKSIKTSISVYDADKGTTLLRPLDFELKIVRVGSEEVVFTKIFKSITSNLEFDWNVPAEMPEGEYGIEIIPLSEFYSSQLVESQNFQVKAPVNWVIYFSLIFTSSFAGFSIFVSKKKNLSKKSVEGILLLHNSGVPIAEKVSSKYTKNDPLLFSGAVLGVLTILKEITGSSVRTIEIDGGYLNLIKQKDFWLVLFMKRNPKWIERTILKCCEYIQAEFGQRIANWDGRIEEWPIDSIVKRFFRTAIPE